MFILFIIMLIFLILDYFKSFGIFVYNLIVSLMVLNSVVNLIFYVWWFKELRYFLQRMFCFFNLKYLIKLNEYYNENIVMYSLRFYEKV